MNLIISGDGIQRLSVALEISASGERMVVLDNTQISLIDIAESKVNGIEISSKPFKTTYSVSDEMDLSGLKVIAHREDGSSFDVTDKITVTGFDTSSEGTKTVTVHYGTEFSAKFEIIVKGKVDNITDDNNSTQNLNISEKPGDNNGHNANAADTGDQQRMAIFALGIIISGAIYIVVKRKKEYNHN